MAEKREPSKAGYANGVALRLLVAVLAGVAVYLWQHSLVEKERDASRAAQAKVAKLQRQLAQQTGESRGPRPPQFPRSGWKRYFPRPDKTTLVGRPVSAAQELLGVAPISVRVTGREASLDRQVWIYRTTNQEATSLYLFFKGGRVVKGYLDEFNGLPGSSVFSDNEFWSGP